MGTHKKVSISEVKMNPDNPRIIKDDKYKRLVKSIKDFPQMLDIRPIVVNKDMVVLGGNMRLKACKDAGLKEIPIIIAEEFTWEQEKEFIIKDNNSYGEWDWSTLSTEWDITLLDEWDLDLPGFDVNMDEMKDTFTMPEGDRNPYGQITFTLADEQIDIIKQAIDKIKKTEEFKYVETFGNENSNGNALYLLVQEWAGQKK